MDIDLSLKRRIEIEASHLARYFPDVRWYHSAGSLFCEGPVRSNAGAVYGLRAVLPDDYPSSLPRLLVTFPAPLNDADGRPLSRRGPSGSMHILGDVCGHLAICHYHPERWSPTHTLYRVFMKGRVWLEAYERHLATGDDLDTYLAHQEPA